jgi:hypothetical protein
MGPDTTASPAANDARESDALGQLAKPTPEHEELAAKQ